MQGNYIYSRHASAKDFAIWVRYHWSFENNCQWIADVIFKMDDNTIDRRHCAENMSPFRCLAVNIAAITNPERDLPTVRRLATFGTGYWKATLSQTVLEDL